jgi:hypothetical protein
MEHASDVLSLRPVQTPQELNLEKLAKRKTKKTQLSFKQGTAEYKILDQVIRCWFAKKGGYWPGQSVGTIREYLRHIEGKTHGLIKKGIPSRPMHTSRRAALRYWESQSAVAKATCRR